MKQYECQRCRTLVPHDQMYRHELFECPKRPGCSSSSEKREGSA